MAKVVYKIKDSISESLENYGILRVSEVINGEAVLLTSTDGSEIKGNENFSHAASVPMLSVNDKVIMQKISGCYVIMDKLRNPGERPTVGFELNKDGSLNLNSKESITLKTDNAKIEISGNGKILIDGNELYSLSNGINRLQGTSIELN